MKNKVLIFAFLFTSMFGFSQTNGINYKALIKDNLGNVVAGQSVTVQLSILQGVAQTNVYQETQTPTTDANGIVILTIGEGTTSDDFSTINWSSDDHFLKVQINTGSGLTDMGTTQFMAVPYALSAANVTGLEAIDEGNGIAWRLKGRDPANYDNIGESAVDLSISRFASTTKGASGTYATAMGNNTTASKYASTAMGDGTTASEDSSTAMGESTTASGYASTAMGESTTASGDNSTTMGFVTTASGKFSTAMGLRTIASANVSTAIGRYNIGGGNPTSWVETDPLFEVGNGISDANKTNALTVLKNGTITAPSFDLAEITDDKALITKEYLEANSSTGLEAIDEGNGIGYRIKGRDPAFYGNIGSKAVDLSYNSVASATSGATGLVSTAFGGFNTASGLYSTAMGNNTLASGYYSTSLGASTKAEAYGSTAIGRFNIGGGTGGNIIATDPLFEVGNGTSTTRNNALTILKNGKVGIGNHQPAGFLEVKAANTSSQPNINLINEGNTGARINFSNTGTTNGNAWTLYGDSHDIEANSVFNIYHPNAPNFGNILQIKGDGKIGINGAPDADFHLFHGNNGIASGMKLENSSNNAWWRFYVSSGSDDLRLYSASQGTIIIGAFDDISGNYTSTSDRRLKKNLKDLHFNWTDFMKLETLNYQYIAQKDTQEYIGLIAQDVQPIYPELVNYNEDSDVYHMNYSGFGVIAIKAVQELKEEVDQLKSENQNLKAQLYKYEQLETRLLALENKN